MPVATIVQSGAHGLRSYRDLEQPYEKFKFFSSTTTNANAATVIDISQYMEEGNKLTLVVDKADLYVNFNGVATTDGLSMLIPAGTGYTEDNIKITGIISIIRATQSNGRIIGAVWGQ